MTAALSLHNIGLTLRPHFWSRPRALLRDVSITVPRGQMCALLGTNGAGKTTLFKVLLGLLAPSHGHGLLLGQPLGTPRSRARIGFLPERAALPLNSSALAFVTLAARLAGLRRAEARHCAVTALQRVGLTPHAHTSMRHFSKGMQQRVGLAQAIVHAPDLLILDEPLSGLDPPARREVRTLLQAEQQRGAAIFFSTHVLADVLRDCDAAAVLVAGQLVDVAAPYTLLNRATAARPKAQQPVHLLLRDVPAALGAQLVATGQIAHAAQSADTQRWTISGLSQANTVLREAQKAGATLLAFDPDTGPLERWLADGAGPS